MLYKPSDKISYNRSSSGDPNGVVKKVRICKDKKDYFYGRQICTIKCGQFTYDVYSHQIQIRTVEKVEQVYVSKEIKNLSTRRLLMRWREIRHTYPEDHYSIRQHTTHFDNNINEFFNDIGFDDYANEQLAYQLIYEKFKRDKHEIKYELSQRENIELGRGAKKLRQKRAKKFHGQGKNKNK